MGDNEGIGSTNIDDLIDDGDNEMTDDVVNNILHELENDDTNQDLDLNYSNQLNQNTLDRGIDIRNVQRPPIDFLDDESLNTENKDTLSKISDVMNTDNMSLNFCSVDSILLNFKGPIIVFVLSLLLFNEEVGEYINKLLKVFKNEKIISYSGLVLKGVLQAVLFYLIQMFL